jgi:hypothetical protein
VTRLLALYPAAVAVLLLALPLIAPRSGPLTLANIFSVHLASAAVLLAPVAVLWRDRVLRGSLVALAAVALARFGGDWVSVPSSGDTFDGSFATASWNLELGARAGSAAVDALQTIDVDVIALQELGPDHSSACTRIGSSTQNRVFSGWACCRAIRSSAPSSVRTRRSWKPSSTSTARR